MKKKRGKIRGLLSLLLAMLLAVSLLPAQKVLADNGSQSGQGNLTFSSFDSTDLTYGEVQWKNGDADNWHTQTTAESLTATKVRIIVNANGKMVDHMALQRIGADNRTQNLLRDDTIKEQLLSDEGYALESNYRYEFERVAFTSTSGGNGGNNNSQQPTSNQIALLLEGDQWSAFMQACETDGDNNNIFVKVGDQANYQKITDLIASGQVITAPDQQSMLLFDTAITKISLYVKCSDAYMAQFVPDIAGMGYSQASPLVIDAPGTWHLQIDKKVNTIVWNYDENMGQDAYLEHGSAEIIAVNGNKVTKGNGAYDNTGDTKGGHFAANPGDKITIKLTPDYGYQLSGVQLNGGAKLEAGADVSTFTFIMPDTSIHFKGIFTKTADSVVTSGSTVKAASIANGSNAADSGNLKLEVSDNTTYNTTEAQALVADALSAQAVDLSLDQIVSKGDGTNWETVITEFDQPITLSLSLENYDAAYDYTVVRNHNGKLTTLDTKVSDGTVSFETNQFSTYVIVKKAKTTTGSAQPTAGVTTSATSPKTGDMSLPIAWILLWGLGIGGAATFIMRKKNM